jgi:hypothetical protein
MMTRCGWVHEWVLAAGGGGAFKLGRGSVRGQQELNTSAVPLFCQCGTRGMQYHTCTWGTARPGAGRNEDHARIVPQGRNPLVSLWE